MFGVDRALAHYRKVDVSGKDLHGAEVKERVNICEVGPFICLKLQAYHNRAQSKDVFDIVRAVRDYDWGTEAAVAAFRAESGCNLAFDCAIHTLQERFGEIKSKGPMQYADFCAGSLMSDSSADTEYLEQQYANEAIDAARALLS